ncbi:hypothetical protein PCASD_25891, partial [Puccinia coronata f. sp. avenae]
HCCPPPLPLPAPPLPLPPHLAAIAGCPAPLRPTTACPLHFQLTDRRQPLASCQPLRASTTAPTHLTCSAPPPTQPRYPCPLPACQPLPTACQPLPASAAAPALPTRGACPHRCQLLPAPHPPALLPLPAACEPLLASAATLTSLTCCQPRGATAPAQSTASHLCAPLPLPLPTSAAPAHSATSFLLHCHLLHPLWYNLSDTSHTMRFRKIAPSSSAGGHPDQPNPWANDHPEPRHVF